MSGGRGYEGGKGGRASLKMRKSLVKGDELCRVPVTKIEEIPQKFSKKELSSRK